MLPIFSGEEEEVEGNRECQMQANKACSGSSKHTKKHMPLLFIQEAPNICESSHLVFIVSSHPMAVNKTEFVFLLRREVMPVTLRVLVGSCIIPER